MTIKKDHSIGEGTGAVAGAVTGAVVGSAAGPVGTVVGAIAGGALGAKGGGAIAEAVNPTEYTTHFEKNYKTAPYYVSGSEWRSRGRSFSSRPCSSRMSRRAAST